jgi:hypothetical protein
VTQEKRLYITLEDVTADFDQLIEAIQGVPANFVYSMDEMGHQE